MENPKTLRELENIGVPPWVIDGWIKNFNQQTSQNLSNYPLTDFQSKTLGNEDFVSLSQNLLVSGPTSSGKTLIAQAAMARLLSQSRDCRIVYLVPLRALVTEKYKQFQAIFGERYRVVPLSSDYPDSDRRIASGNWDIAIPVFEKAYHWLNNPNRLLDFMKNVQLLVADEIQVIDREERGEKLELILSFLRWWQVYQARHQVSSSLRILGLIANETVAGAMQNWLGAKVVPSAHTERPVPLYEGWISTSKEYKIYSDPLTDQQITIQALPEPIKTALQKANSAGNKNPSRLLFNLTAECVKKGMRVLIYTATQHFAEQKAVELALWLSKNNIGPGKLEPRVEAQINDLEETHITKTLAYTMTSRVAFHHGQMTQDERGIVEQGFLESGENPAVSVVVATPTLGMGINLPADVVLMFHHYTYGGKKGYTDPELLMIDDGGEQGRRRLSVLEYRNYAGRAGRLGAQQNFAPFGLCLLIVNKKKQAEEYERIRSMLLGSVKPLQSRLVAPLFGFHPHLLTIINGVECLNLNFTDTTSDHFYFMANQILAYTYAAKSNPEDRLKLGELFPKAFRDIRSVGLLTPDGLSGPGKVIASHNISLEGSKILLDIIDELQYLWPKYRLELLYKLSEIPEIEKEYPRKDPFNVYDRKKTKALKLALREYLINRIHPSSYRKDSVFNIFLNGSEKQKRNFDNKTLIRMMRALAIWEWTTGLPVKRMEETHAFPKLTLKAWESLGERYSLFIGALRGLWMMRIPLPEDEEIANHISNHLLLYEYMLAYGLALDVIALPILVGYGANDRLARNVYRKILTVTGEIRDPSDLLRFKLGDEIIKESAWNKIRRGLEWWIQIRSNQASRVEYPVLTALDNLSGGLYSNDFSLPVVNPETTAPQSINTDKELTEELTSIVSQDVIQTIVKIAIQQLRRFNQDRFKGLDGLVSSVFNRSPLSLKLEGYEPIINRLRKLRIDNEVLNLLMINGQPNMQSFGHIPTSYQDLILISNIPPDHNLVQKTQRKVRLYITTEALYSGSELVIRYPHYRRQFLKVLVSYRGLIRSGEEMINLILKTKLQSLDKLISLLEDANNKSID